MTSYFRTCLDGHRCENGSSCMQHPLEEGTYFCDCTTSTADVAGLFCEYKAETYCQLNQETSSTWFCVNQGTCVLTTSDSAQYTCDCPPEYEGPVRTDTNQRPPSFESFFTPYHSILFRLLRFVLLCFVALSIYQGKCPS
jgi:hypothetical protein